MLSDAVRKFLNENRPKGLVVELPERSEEIILEEIQGGACRLTITVSKVIWIPTKMIRTFNPFHFRKSLPVQSHSSIEWFGPLVVEWWEDIDLEDQVIRYTPRLTNVYRRSKVGDINVEVWLLKRNSIEPLVVTPPSQLVQTSIPTQDWPGRGPDRKLIQFENEYDLTA